MELLDDRTKSVLDRLTHLADGNRVLVLDALTRYQRKEIPDMRSVIEFIQGGGDAKRPSPSPAEPAPFLPKP